MLASGQHGDWQKVAELDLERRSLLTGSIDTAHPDDTSNTAALLREILDVNTDITKLATAAKDASAEELTRATLGRRVVRAYQAVGK